MVLVTLVVVGHAIVLLPYSDLEQQAYDFIYYFHIPVFVLVTGYLSRSFSYTPRHLWSLVTTLAVPYVIFSWLMVQFRHHVGDGPLLDPIWTNPRWPMWYLAVLIIWRLATPVLKVHWVMVPISIVVSLLAGAYDQELFDLNRALGLLPFFVIGLHLTPAAAGSAQTPLRVGGRRRHPAGHLVAGRPHRRLLEHAVALLPVVVRVAGREPGRGRLDPRAADPDLARRLASRCSAWCRSDGRFLTDMGAYTLVVYLLHGFLIRYADFEDWARFLPANDWASLVIVVVLAIGWALLLAWPPVASKLNYLVDPINSLWQPKFLAKKARPPLTRPSPPADATSPSNGRNSTDASTPARRKLLRSTRSVRLASVRLAPARRATVRLLGVSRGWRRQAARSRHRARGTRCARSPAAA